MEHLTIETFKEKVFDYEKNNEWEFLGDKPCIIDFYADWCNPCRMLMPVLEEISKEYEGEVNIYKVDTQQYAELAGLFNVSSIPTLLFCKKGAQPEMLVGMLSKNDLKDKISEKFNISK